MNDSKTSDDIIYCHGLPGSSNEIYFLNSVDTRPTKILGPQDVGKYKQYLLENPNQHLHVIGFSLGAMTAIKIVENNEHSVHKLSLISPAAPLELGHFLPQMAGKLVFQTAIKSALLFRLVTAVQNIGVHLSSDYIIKSIFKGSPTSETALLTETAFKESLVTGFKESYGPNNLAYRNAITEYVQPWANRLNNISCSVSIHHGTADNWAPVEMAHALQKAIRSNVNVIEYNGLGHFSTLKKALPIVMKS